LLISYPWKTQNAGYFETGVLLSSMFCNDFVVWCGADGYVSGLRAAARKPDT